MTTAELEQQQRMAISAEFFRTPAEVTRAILPHLGLTGTERILEPSAGDGAILDVLLEAGHPRDLLAACELRSECINALGTRLPNGCVVIGDYLQVARQAGTGDLFDVILTNPPFSLFVPFAEASFPLLKPGGRLVMFGRICLLGTKGRKTFWRAHPADMHCLSWRPSFTGNGVTDSAQEYGWFVWTDGRKGPGRIYHLDRPGQPGQLSFEEPADG